MACGCSKKNLGSRRTVRPAAAGRSITPALTQSQLRNSQANPAAQAAELNSEKRKLQALRRDAISKAFNK